MEKKNPDKPVLLTTLRLGTGIESQNLLISLFRWEFQASLSSMLWANVHLSPLHFPRCGSQRTNLPVMEIEGMGRICDSESSRRHWGYSIGSNNLDWEFQHTSILCLPLWRSELKHLKVTSSNRDGSSCRHLLQMSWKTVVIVALDLSSIFSLPAWWSVNIHGGIETDLYNAGPPQQFWEPIMLNLDPHKICSQN